MEWLPENPKDWLPELASALKAIARAFSNAEVTPGKIEAKEHAFADAVPEHTVGLHWFENGYMYVEEIDEPRPAEYAVTISGDRMKAGWLIPAADLSRVLAAAISY